MIGNHTRHQRKETVIMTDQEGTLKDRMVEVKRNEAKLIYGILGANLTIVMKHKRMREAKEMREKREISSLKKVK